MALAFQSDTTRICTFMFGNAVSGRNFSFLDGVKGGHHDISHHQKDADKLRDVSAHQPLAHRAVRLPAAQAAQHEGGRRDRARQLDDPVRRGPARRRRPQPAQPADRARRPRRRADRQRASTWSTRRTRRCRTSTSRCSTPSARRSSGSPTAPARCRACWPDALSARLRRSVRLHAARGDRHVRADRDVAGAAVRAAAAAGRAGSN